MDERTIEAIAKLIAVIGVVFFIALPVMLLWNNVVVKVFPLPDITYWQALGLFVFVQLFFINKPELDD